VRRSETIAIFGYRAARSGDPIIQGGAKRRPDHSGRREAATRTYVNASERKRKMRLLTHEIK
jgi:hypothetical protein